VPIELLDVAGLVPGAHEGRGLGNRFLDALRHADALIHVVDASGTVDAEGKETRGYDPSVDIAWLRSEIVAWVKGNLMDKWGGIRRRHVAVKATAAETMQGQWSGYGSTPALAARALDRSGVKTPLDEWDDATISRVVDAFMDEKFPTVIALNKIDHPDSDKNVAKIAKMQDPNSIVLCSAVSEVFLRKMAKQKYVRYTEGGEFVDTRDDLVEMGEPDGGGLRELDERNKARIEEIRDMVLYRYGSTGVVQVLSRAADLLGLVPVFPVRSTSTFSAGANEHKHVFRDCVLVGKGATVADVARKVMGDAPIAYVEGVGGTRVSEDDIVAVGKNDVGSAPMIIRSRCLDLANVLVSLADIIVQGWKGLVLDRVVIVSSWVKRVHVTACSVVSEAIVSVVSQSTHTLSPCAPMQRNMHQRMRQVQSPDLIDISCHFKIPRHLNFQSRLRTHTSHQRLAFCYNLVS
jgi:ribosome-binding ATPase YchF (GTP1/OBG family)